MARTPSRIGARKPSGKAKSSKKSALAVSAGHSAAIEGAARLDEDRIRERAYGIWIAEGSRTAENSRICSAPTTSCKARLSNAPYGAPADLKEARTRVSPMSGCRQPRRDAGAEAASVPRPDLANGA
jgi:hypothetical protein